MGSNEIKASISAFSKDFSGKAKKVVGIDISEKCIEYAETKNYADNVDYLVIDINNLDTIDEKFDIVFSDMVFNYIEDYNKLLFNIYNLLNDNGIVVFSQVHPISTASLGESSWVKEDNKLRFKLDNYSNVSKRYRIRQTPSVKPEIDVNVIATMNFENGYMDITMQGKKDADGIEPAISGKFRILRSNNDGLWYEIHRFVLPGL